MECTHENRYDFGRQCSDCNQWLGPEKVIEKTWEIREKELREQIAQEIEKMEASTNIGDIKVGHLMARNWAAEIARGQK